MSALSQVVMYDADFQAACQRYAHANGSSAAIAQAALRAADVEELIAVAREGLAAMQLRQSEILRSHCLLDDQGEPIRATLDTDCEEEIGELEQAITRAAACLARAGGRP
jgi:hypothetical protein